MRWGNSGLQDTLEVSLKTEKITRGFPLIRLTQCYRHDNARYHQVCARHCSWVDYTSSRLLCPPLQGSLINRTLWPHSIPRLVDNPEVWQTRPQFFRPSFKCGVSVEAIHVDFVRQEVRFVSQSGGFPHVSSKDLAQLSEMLLHIGDSILQLSGLSIPTEKGDTQKSKSVSSD